MILKASSKLNDSVILWNLKQKKKVNIKKKNKQENKKTPKTRPNQTKKTPKNSSVLESFSGKIYMGMYCFCIMRVVTCKLDQNLTNATSVENNWREITFGCFRTSRKELMKEFKQLHHCLCGFDLGNSSIGPIWHHLLVYLLWQLGNQKWTFTLHPFTKCSFIQLMSKRFIVFYFFFSSLS